jgi:hypothetical protein
VVRRNSEPSKVIHDGPIERLLRIQRATGEQVDADQGVALVLLRRNREAMRLVDEQANGPVPLRRPDSRIVV